MGWLTNVIFSTALLYGIAVFSVGRLTLSQNHEQEAQRTDEAGPYVIGNEKDRSKKVADVRGFLWEHWREHRPGRVLVTWISKEGRQANTIYLLENDERGAWSLRVTIQRPSSKGGSPNHDSVEYIAYSIRRIEPRHDGKSPAVFIADNDSRLGSAYWLVFFDAKGNETAGV